MSEHSCAVQHGLDDDSDRESPISQTGGLDVVENQPEFPVSGCTPTEVTSSEVPEADASVPQTSALDHADRESEGLQTVVSPPAEENEIPREKAFDVPEASACEALETRAGASWWRRILAKRIRTEAVAEAVSEPGPSSRTRHQAAEGRGRQEDEARAEAVPQARAEMSRWRDILDWLIRSRSDAATVPEVEEVVTTPVETPAVAQPLILNDVRVLVQEEILRAQEYATGQMQDELAQVRYRVPELVRAELNRWLAERSRAAQATLEGLAAEVSAANLTSLRAELDLLDQAELRTLQDSGAPLQEQLRQVDWIRERRRSTQARIAEMEGGEARGATESNSRLSELLTGRPWMGAGPQRRWRLGGVGPTLLGLVLVAAVGVAGILLPRQAERDAAFLVEMATMYQTVGKAEEAVRVLDEAVEAGIYDVETLGHVGEMYRLLEQYEKAIDVLKRAVDRDPQAEDYGLSLARSYGSAGQQRKAIAQYEALIEINPANSLYYVEIGHRYRSLKDYDQALAQYQKALEVDPTFWGAHYFQMEVYRAMGRYDQAIEQCHKVLEINPNHYWTRVYGGLSYAGKNDLVQAIEQYQAAIEILPDRHEAYYYLGEVYLAQRLFDQALEAYGRAIEKNDRHTESYVGLGKTYLELGDCASARVHFVRALKLDPRSYEAQEGLVACEGE